MRSLFAAALSLAAASCSSPEFRTASGRTSGPVTETPDDTGDDTTGPEAPVVTGTVGSGTTPTEEAGAPLTANAACAAIVGAPSDGPATLAEASQSGASRAFAASHGKGLTCVEIRYCFPASAGGDPVAKDTSTTSIDGACTSDSSKKCVWTFGARALPQGLTQVQFYAGRGCLGGENELYATRDVTIP